MAFDMRVDATKKVVDSHVQAAAVLASQSSLTTDGDDPLLAAQAKFYKRFAV
jgi:protein-disulfide isomerase-like protein with CxxC motif